MPQRNEAEFAQDPRLNHLQELLMNYLKKMDMVKLGPHIIFRSESSKVDLETKVWHHFYKIEAMEYRCRRVGILTAGVKESLIKMANFKVGKPVGSSFELRLAVQNREILYEVDAFFAAGQSALDFLASVISRYIRGKDTDEFDKLTKFLRTSLDPVADFVTKAWTEWVDDFVNYRDYLLHRGVLPTAAAVHVNTSGAEMSYPKLVKFRKLLLGREHGPVVFPLPLKPNPSIRLTRQDVLGLDESPLPTGIIEMRTTVTLSSCKTDGGPKVRVSVGRRINSMQIDATAESVLGKRSDSVSSVRYELAPGYTEADKFCQNLYGKLTDLSLEVFKQLMIVDFKHLA